MSQDVLSDALSKIMNAKLAGHTTVTLNFHSKLLMSVLAIAKLKGYIKDYSLENNNLVVQINKLNKCNSIKPRFFVTTEEIELFAKRYLPAKDIGILILSTSKGIMTHKTALEKNIGGSLLAYFY